MPEPARIVVVCGPTASGKTALGVLLAKEFGGEVVSADSMQLYRRMDIGTAKPTPEEMQGIRHHMIDVLNPEEDCSVARYVEEATACVEDILRRHSLPIVVGGTGLYIDSLVRGLDFSERADPDLRAQLSAEYDALGGEAMLEKLRGIDPERAALLHANDKRRITRALEIFLLTGKTITAHDEETRRAPPRYQAARIFLGYADRAKLYERIDSRVEEMRDRGLTEEVRVLLESGVSPQATAMQAIGYKELAAALRGETDLETAYEDIKRESRRYAKRQMTWFSRNAEAKRIFWDKERTFDFARQESTAFLRAAGIE